MAVLSLAAGADEEHDELTGDFERYLVAMVFFDERKGEVNTGGDAGGGVGGAVAEVDGVGLDVDERKLAGEAVAEVPMSDGLFAVEKAGGGEDEGSGADGGDAAGALRGGVGPREEVGVVVAAFGSGAADDEESVDGAGDFMEGDGVAERDAAAGLEGCGGLRRREEDVVAGSAGEDLEGAGDVEDLDWRRAGDDDPAHGFKSTRLRARACPKLL